MTSRVHIDELPFTRVGKTVAAPQIFAWFHRAATPRWSFTVS
jgi:hypothetical protein